MRILTISLNAWNDTIATGNTFSNFFSNKKNDDEFANIFCRNEKIDNVICHRYFRITEREILDGVVCPSKVWGSFTTSSGSYSGVDRFQSILSFNNPKGNFLRRWRPALLLLLRELIWCIPSWKSRYLKEFLKEFKPDIIYMHVHSNWYMHKLLWFCKKHTGAKVVVFSGDDVWTLHRKGVLHLLYGWILRKYLCYTFTHADLVCGGSPQLCEEFSDVFSIKIKPLFKTCNHLSEPGNKTPHSPLIVVYCGNLLYGRESVLIEIAKQIRVINKNTMVMQLHIYSNTVLHDKELYWLNDRENCFFDGPKPFFEIREILDECDFSLFAESYDPKYIKETRLSFSTKIIDYIQSSSAIIVVGPSEIASIDYLIRTNVAFIVDKPEHFAETVTGIISSPEIIRSSVERKYDYAKKNHKDPLLLKMMRELIN